MILTYSDPIVGEIRPSVQEDCAIIGRDMCKQDAMEMWSYDRSSPISAVYKSFNKSVICMTIIHEVPIAMFGIIPINMSSGILWMLTTDGLRDGKFGRPFVRNCKKWFNEMLDIYPRLYGMTDLRNTVSIKWLGYLGVEWIAETVEGVDKMPFKTFRFVKKE